MEVAGFTDSSAATQDSTSREPCPILDRADGANACGATAGADDSLHDLWFTFRTHLESHQYCAFIYFTDILGPA